MESSLKSSVRNLRGFSNARGNLKKNRSIFGKPLNVYWDDGRYCQLLPSKPITFSPYSRHGNTTVHTNIEPEATYILHFFIREYTIFN